MFLFTKNLTENKFNTSFIEIFKIKKIRDIIVFLKLSNIKTFFRFYISVIKKALKETSIITI